MKRSLAFCLALALSFALSPGPAEGDSPIYAKLTVPLLFDLETPPDVEKINAAVNAITREKIGAEIQLIPLLYFSHVNTDLRRQAELDLLSKEGITFDLVNDSLPGEASLLPLSDLLDCYGQGLTAAIGAERLNFYREKDGQIYRLPSVSDYVSTQGVAMRKDVLDQHGLDASGVRTLEDLDQLFQTLRALEPDLALVCGYRTGQAIFNRGILSNLAYETVFCQSADDPSQLVNYYATQEYRELLSYYRKWYLRGYMPSSMALQNISASSLVQSGELFSYSTAWKPGIEFEAALSCSTEMLVIPLTEPVVSPSTAFLRYWGISDTCLNPGKAMQFLNLLYTDADLINLLLYGIEGEHYEILENGLIDYPEGVDRNSVGYVNSMPWLIPNQLLSHVWAGNDPDLWEKTLAYNQSAPLSGLLGFQFDDDLVSRENRAINAIVERYAYGLGSGQLDPEIYLPEMLEEMEAAGLERVLAEIQSQFTAWLATKEEPI